MGGPHGLGGEQTIGARIAKGVIQQFDTYQFVSKSYYDIKYYFRSLDTWLDGVCRSFCKEHPWNSRYETNRGEVPRNVGLNSNSMINTNICGKTSNNNDSNSNNPNGLGSNVNGGSLVKEFGVEKTDNEKFRDLLGF